MATAVLDVELERLPNEITGLGRYNRAQILIRFRGRPVDQVFLRLRNGRIDGISLREVLLKDLNWTFWECWLHSYLGWEERCSNDHPIATIAVCTHDRPEDLQRCMEGLMRLPDDGQEYIVIDNCPSTDATRCIVGQYERIRYIREDHPGSSAARNRALREAKHDIVAFTDDDAMPDPGWLRALLCNFHDPRVLCVTGLVMPVELENEAQEFFEKHNPLGRGFTRRVYDGADWSRFRVAPVGVSANMALHRKILASVGAFDEVLGVGTPTRCGEDHDLFSRILARGYKIVYEPAALSWHRHRRTWEETRKTFYSYGVGVYAFWTRSLLVEKEFGVLRLPWQWLYHIQIPNLVRSLLRHPGSVPLGLLLAELRGCLVGTWAYLLSRKQSSTRSKQL